MSRCLLVLPVHLQGLVGLRVLSLSEISKTQREFPRLASFVRLAELSVKHTAYSNFPPPADLASLGALQRLVLQNLPIEAVDGIWLLSNLRDLRLTDLDITHLPDEIGRLSRLAVLKLKQCNWLEDLPTALRTLPALAWLVLSTTPENIRDPLLFSDTYMFRRTARLLPCMPGLRSLHVRVLGEDEGLALALALRIFPPPLLASVLFVPSLRGFLSDNDAALRGLPCAAIVGAWQLAVRKAEAFVCGSQPHMGAHSLVALLNRDVIKLIVSAVLGRVPQGSTFHDLVDDAQLLSFRAVSGA